MKDIKAETIVVIESNTEQDFKDYHEINNQVYTFDKNTTEKDFNFGSWEFTDVSIAEMKEAQKTLKNSEMGIILMSESNIEAFLKEFF